MSAPTETPRREDGTMSLNRPENWLLIVSAWEYLSLMLSTQASNQVWLDFYAGDYGAQARAMGKLSAAGGALGFVVKPVLAQLSDVYGRKPLLLLSYIIQIFVKGGIAVAPASISVPLLAVSQYLLGFVTWELSAQTIDAAIGKAHTRLTRQPPPPPTTPRPPRAESAR